MKCLGCGRNLPPTSQRCMYCGGQVEQTTQDDGLLRCPGCGQCMDKTEEGKVVVDDCPGCGGSWYDLGELDSIVADKRAEASPAEDGKVERFKVQEASTAYRKCPRCAQPMMRRNYGKLSGVIVDACSRHGVFLDAGELEQIVRFVATGGEALGKKAEADEKKHLERQQRAAQQIVDRNREMRYRASRYSRRGFAGSLLLDVLSETDF